MEKAIYFDMDGTIADLFGVDNWLADLRNNRTRPYHDARPLWNMRELSKLLRKVQNAGYKIGVISWGAMEASDNFQSRIEKSKKAWLKRHLPSVIWDEIYITRYGVPKSSCGSGILFDDSRKNRAEWVGKAYHPNDIFKILKESI